MFALIVSINANEEVFVSAHRNKLDDKAIAIIRAEFKKLVASNDTTNSAFTRLVIESIEHKVADALMDAFSNLADEFGLIVEIRIVPAFIEMDS